MTETITIALITFASALIGTCVGAIATYRVAKLTSDTDLKKRLHDERYMAYAEFMNAYIQFCGFVAAREEGPNEPPIEYERELYERFNSTCAKASLISSKETTSAINRLLFSMNRFGATSELPKDINKQYTDVVDEMRKELISRGKSQL